MRRARELEIYERNERNLVLSFSFDPSFAAATRQFSRAFDTLERTPLRASQQAQVDKYYDDVFLPRLAENVSSTPTAQSYIPESPAAGYLQLNYTTTSDDFDTLIQIDDAEDGSARSRIHRRYHPYFRDSALWFGFDDVLLIDNAGRVVYSVPLPEMIPAVKAGRVQAIAAVEPLVTQGKDAAAVGVEPFYARTAPDLTVATFVTSEPYEAENPDIVERFIRAINTSLVYAAR